MVLPPMNVAARIVSKFKKENAESAITRYGFSVGVLSFIFTLGWLFWR